MGSIQISSMSWERSGKPGRFSFFPKGALTHHPEGAVVSRPLAGPVRSAEGYPLLSGSTGYAAIHKLSQLVCLPKEIGSSGRSPCRIWLPAKTCHRQLFCKGT